MDKKLAEKLGIAFELGFKEKIIDLLTEDFKDKELKRNKIKNLEEYILKKINMLAVEGIVEGAKVEGTINSLNSLRKVGQICSYSYIKEMLYLNKKFNPYFPKPLFAPERDKPCWENADVLFIQDKALYIFELTLFGGKRIHDILSNPLKGKIIELKLYLDGLNVDVGYEKEDIYSITEKLISGIKVEDAILYSVKEYGKLMQLMFYLYDFLLRDKYDVKEVYINLVYPFNEGLKARLAVPYIDMEKIKDYRDKLLKLREILKPDKRSLKKEIFGREIDIIIEKLNKEIYTITPKNIISQVREDVKNIVEKYENTYGNVVALCHPAGAGKTTSIIKSYLKKYKDDNILFMYFSPRTAITKDKSQNINKIIENTDENILVIDDEVIDNKKGLKSNRSYKKVKDIETQDKGKLKSILEKIKISARKYDSIAVFTTMQTITKVSKGFVKSNTINTLSNIISAYRERKNNGKIILVFDEILADSTGLFKLKEILEKLKKFQNYLKIFILDANLSNGYIFETLLNRIEEYKKKNIDYLPSSIYEVYGNKLNKEVYQFKFSDWKIISYTKPSFIGSHLNLSFKIDFLNNEDELVNKIIEIIMTEEEKAFIYIQNKEIAGKIKHQLEKYGKKVVLKTSKHSIGNIEDAYKYDFVIGTSSISRGIDVPFKKAYGFFYEANAEQEIAEFYQALSRLRGIKDKDGKNIDEEIDRDVNILLFRILNKKDIDNLDIENIDDRRKYIFLKRIKTAQLIGLKNLLLSSIKAYIDPRCDELYYLSFPEVKEPKYDGNHVSEIKELAEIAILINKKLHYKIDSIIDSKETTVIYPFRFYKDAEATIEINKNELFELKKELEKRKEIAKRKEYIKSIDNILKSHYYSNNKVRIREHISIAEYIPFKVYKIPLNVKVRFPNKYITRKNLEIAGTLPLISVSSDNRLFISMLELPNDRYTFNPKIPIEIFF